MSKRKRNLLTMKKLNMIIKNVRKKNDRSLEMFYKWLLCEFKEESKKVGE